MGTLCEKELEKSKEHKWKIKILNAFNKAILIGVAPTDFDITSSNYKYGWYLNCYDSSLICGKPFDYHNKKTNLNKVKEEVIVIMNMDKRTLKFIIDNEDKGESYNDIPLDKPISPSVLMAYQNDSIEIIEC